MTVNYSKELVNTVSNMLVHANTIEGNLTGIKKSFSYRRRNMSLIKYYLLRFMLIRNKNPNELLKLLELTLEYNFK